MQLRKRHDQLSREIENGTKAILSGGADSEALTRALQREVMLKEVDAKLQEIRRLDPAHITVPSDAWLAQELSNLHALVLAGGGQSAVLLRTIFGKIMVEEVVMPGKKRGHIKLHVRLQGMAIVKAMDQTLPTEAFPDNAADSEAIVLTIGKQSRMDELAVKVLALRKEGMSFRAMDKLLKMGTGNISNILKRMKAS